MLEYQNITKKFGDFTALDNVSFEVPEGRIFGLLGPNGAGKTTLIRITNRITIPTGGRVIYNGRQMTDEMVRMIGYLPEERGLYKKMKVGEQMMYLARLKGLSKDEAVKALREWFVRFKIQSWWDKKVEELSKGMAQKVQFISTVIHKPKLLILDEPFSGFDPVNAQVIRNEILRLKDEGSTIILSTHNMESVEELCDEIALINKSHLVLRGRTDQIREQYGENQVELLYSGECSLDGAGTFSVAQQETLHDHRRAVLNLGQGCGIKDIVAEVAASGAEIISVRKMMPRMNDIFIKLVNETSKQE